MASTSETGNAKNVANFENLILFCTGYSASYNPSKASIKMSALVAKHTEAVQALAKVNNTIPLWTNAVHERELIFSALSKLITRILNAVAASEVPKDAVANVKTITRKLQGKRASAKVATVADNPATPANESQKSISASQMSFDSRIENMDKLIQQLIAQTGYKPNEADLTVEALSMILSTMKGTNLKVIKVYTLLSNARIERDKTLYDEATGLVVVAADVKTYIKSVFGGGSAQYKQISKLKFSK